MSHWVLVTEVSFVSDGHGSRTSQTAGTGSAPPPSPRGVGGSRRRRRQKLTDMRVSVHFVTNAS